jgi:hypothetical protein
MGLSFFFSWRKGSRTYLLKVFTLFLQRLPMDATRLIQILLYFWLYILLLLLPPRDYPSIYNLYFTRTF